MYRPITPPPGHRQTLLDSLGLWLVGGSLLLLSGLLPVHSALLGWSLPFWLVLTPLLLALTVDPELPGRWLRRLRSRRRAIRTSAWS